MENWDFLILSSQFFQSKAILDKTTASQAQGSYTHTRELKINKAPSSTYNWLQTGEWIQPRSDEQLI